MTEMNLSEGAELIIQRLYNNGYTAHAVGGSVRDHILGRRSDDCDITTSATPSEIKAVFSDLRTIDTGIKHGTVTVIFEGEQYEVTTYREDGEYLDNRHPSSVSFTRSLSSDLSRRDFTVNAMAYNHKEGYTDLFGGMDDLNNKIIRAVGDAEKRFTEDALRILRAVRFASVLGFTIEKNTAGAAREKKHLLQGISKERVFVEWQKLLGGENAYSVIKEYADVIEAAIPHLKITALPKEGLFKKAEGFTRALSLYYLSSAIPCEDFSLSMKELKTDTRTRELGRDALKIVGSTDLTSEKSITLALMEYGLDAVSEAIRLSILVEMCDTSALTTLDEIIREERPYKISDLHINGNDLIRLGVKGREIGEILSTLLKKVIIGETENSAESLLSCAMNIKK